MNHTSVDHERNAMPTIDENVVEELRITYQCVEY